MISAIVLALFLASIVGTVMAAPEKALEKNPNIWVDGEWLCMENGSGQKEAWNLVTGEHAVYLDTSKLGVGALAAHYAHGWVDSVTFPGYIYKLVQ